MYLISTRLNLFNIMGDLKMSNKTRKQKEDLRRELVRDVALYYTETQATVRKTAQVFGKSKTWIHNVLKKDVAKMFPEFADDVNSLIETNKNERHMRGGLAAAISNQKRKKNGGK